MEWYFGLNMQYRHRFNGCNTKHVFYFSKTLTVAFSQKENSAILKNNNKAIGCNATAEGIQLQKLTIVNVQRS